MDIIGIPCRCCPWVVTLFCKLVWVTICCWRITPTLVLWPCGWIWFVRVFGWSGTTDLVWCWSWVGWWWTWSSTLLIWPTNDPDDPGLREPFKAEMGIGCWGKGTSRGRWLGLLIVETEAGWDTVGCVGAWETGDADDEDNTKHNLFKHAFLSFPGPP